ncbi:hypothetical protein BS50DRAFT_572184 [Corynespora cassiicola Philippines]|uniref:Uncharacterized protein n=1 Tax=Corynespora cassiicola Philippines TaxID=1448308 RepID=A0A2T2NUD0_CORCC|nr:hypothetical protein BS50DRAFT_572184 [Corynespora cassiicola Philippines]
MAVAPKHPHPYTHQIEGGAGCGWEREPDLSPHWNGDGDGGKHQSRNFDSSRSQASKQASRDIGALSAVHSLLATAYLPIYLPYLPYQRTSRGPGPYGPIP